MNQLDQHTPIPEHKLTCSLTGLLALLAVGAPFSTALAQDPVESIMGPRAIVAARRDSLERVAIAAPNVQQRAGAIIWIALTGRVWYHVYQTEEPPAAVTYPGVIASLRRVYAAAGASERQLITSLLQWQEEREESIQFLVELAQGDNEAGLTFPIQNSAVAILSRMGSRGAAALRDLHAAGDSLPLIRRQLEELARTGYRQPPRG